MSVAGRQRGWLEGGRKRGGFVKPQVRHGNGLRGCVGSFNED